eukprot:TRINITY_DN2523_c0_g1_i1.p1 TRINITY_DN2523_c0_g1~~TRINITY_DN2523_c0_g1_i1.p1  ORF type:complete len:420 (+),score=56.28 TRINITY_DN2523_c0_g1_i1:126-1262(+)
MLGLDAIVAQMRAKDINTQSDACDLIAVLASGSEETRDTIMKQPSILELLLNKLKNTGKDELRYSAARALVSFCYNDRYRQDILKQGALPALLDFARQGKIQIAKQIKESEIQRGKFLGAGAFAKVHQGTFRDKVVAIKIFSENSYAFRLEDFYREVAIMSMLSHDHIVSFEGACVELKSDDESVFIIVTELMHKGSLKKLLDGKPLELSLFYRYALHTCLGMIYLHSLELIHRDLKCENVLVNSQDIAKLADFGLSRDIDLENGMTASVGTPKWEAPEVLVRSKTKTKYKYSKEADVYSFGILLYEMVSGEEPFPSVTDIFELKKLVVDRHKRPNLPKHLPPELTLLIKSCWHRAPSKRPSFQEIYEKLEKVSLKNK